MVTLLIILITGCVSGAALYREDVMNKFIFNPYVVKNNNEWYRFVSSGFIHADWIHLLVNMFVFYSFGNFVENAYNAVFPAHSAAIYLILYIGGMIISDIPTFFKYKNQPYYNALGASGAVSAVVFAGIIFAPWQKLYLFGAIPIPAVFFGAGYLVYSYYMSKRNVQDQINHDAHFYGAVFGMGFTFLMKPELAEYFIRQLVGEM